MSICDSEENRKKLAWLVPGYILLAWFFCVLFQPFGVQTPASASSSASSARRFLADDRHYEIVYLQDEDSDGEYDDKEAIDDEQKYTGICNNNSSSSVITLESGAKSALIVRLAHGYYPYRPFNCSLQISAGNGLDGLTAVIEEMDLREHEDDRRQPGGHWGSSICLDWVEVFTDKTKTRNKLCGRWNEGDADRLNSYGPRQALIGYCYDDRSGHSCESDTVFINVAIDADPTLSEKYGVGARRSKGFAIVVTGYRHLKDSEKACHDTDEFTCKAHDLTLHEKQPHCIWNELRCDSHQNCGFTYNMDESDCVNKGIPPWSISSMTFLIITYLAIVVILVFVTMLLLSWHKSLRIPLDVISDSGRGMEAMMASNQEISASSNGLTSTASPERRPTGTVSIIVSYRPLFMPKTTECPPSYESLFLDEHPPHYNAVVLENEDERSGQSGDTDAAPLDEDASGARAPFAAAATIEQDIAGHILHTNEVPPPR